MQHPPPLAAAGQVQHNFADLAENIPPEGAESETGTKCGDSVPKVPRKHKTGTKCGDSVPVSCPFLLLSAEEAELSWFHIGRKDDIAILP